MRFKKIWNANLQWRIIEHHLLKRCTKLFLSFRGDKSDTCIRHWLFLFQQASYFSSDSEEEEIIKNGSGDNFRSIESNESSSDDSSGDKSEGEGFNSAGRSTKRKLDEAIKAEKLLSDESHSEEEEIIKNDVSLLSAGKCICFAVMGAIGISLASIRPMSSSKSSKFSFMGVLRYFLREHVKKPLKAIRNEFFARPEVMQDTQAREASSSLQRFFWLQQ